jgi:hypothetical protein
MVDARICIQGKTSSYKDLVKLKVPVSGFFFRVWNILDEKKFFYNKKIKLLNSFF